MALSAAEQYGIELLNRARMDPSKEAALQNVGLNQGLKPGAISTTPKQVLAPSTQLQSAAEKHSSYMLRVDSFSHENIGDGTPTSRIKSTGFWNGASGQAYTENINYASVGYSNSLERLTAIQHGMLFDSSGHRANLMANWVNEIGYGLVQGSFGGNKVSMVTQVFGARQRTYVTGVAYNDTKNNNFYNLGEGRKGVTFALEDVRSVQTAAAGGYALQVAPSDETRVLVNGGDLAVVVIDTLAGQNGFNAKLDVVFEKDGSKQLLVSTSATLESGSITDMRALGISGIDLTGGEADNRLWGNSGKNTLKGEGGADVLYGLDGNDNLNGGLGNDTLRGGNHDDILNGQEDSDQLFGEEGNDTLRGGVGDDTLDGGNGHDSLDGGQENDQLFGGAGNDTVLGSEGDDTLSGGDGADRIEGGPGSDQLTGGAGADVFVFGSVDDQVDDSDVITDFDSGDTLQLASSLINNEEIADWLQQNAVEQSGNVIMTFEFGDTLTVQGITIAELVDQITVFP